VPQPSLSAPSSSHLHPKSSFDPLIAAASRPPKATEIARGTIYGTSQLSRDQVRSLRIHAKPVGGSIQRHKIRELSFLDPKVRAEWDYQEHWLDDPEFYKAVPTGTATDLGFAKEFTDENIERMEEECDLIRKLDAGEEPLGAVNLWKLPELHKDRARPIRETKAVNDTLPCDPEHAVRFIPKAGIPLLLLEGECALALDFSAYYDQFHYSKEVGRRFCFRHGNHVYALKSLAMGQRQAVNVAVALTNLLVDFERKSRRCETYIDNIIFVGTREQVLADARVFVERCNHISAIINEDVTKLEDYIFTKGEWCGVALDFDAKTAAMTEKSVSRTISSWANRNIWTWRGWAAHIGLLFWSHGIIDVPMHSFFPLLSFMSRASARLTEDPSLWDKQASIWPSAMEIMEEWTQLIVQNSPRRVRAMTDPEWLVCTDASRWGWGYVAVHSFTGEVRSHGARWSSYMEKMHGNQLGSSTFAEPHGVVNSLCHLIAPGAGVQRVRVATDNMATRWAFEKGWSPHAPQFNFCLARFKRIFPEMHIEMSYVKGELNPADRPSRGASYTSEEMGAVADCLRQVMGSRQQQLE